MKGETDSIIEGGVPRKGTVTAFVSDDPQTCPNDTLASAPGQHGRIVCKSYGRLKKFEALQLEEYPNHDGRINKVSGKVEEGPKQ